MCDLSSGDERNEELAATGYYVVDYVEKEPRVCSAVANPGLEAGEAGMKNVSKSPGTLFLIVHIQVHPIRSPA